MYISLSRITLNILRINNDCAESFNRPLRTGASRAAGLPHSSRLVVNKNVEYMRSNRGCSRCEKNIMLQWKHSHNRAAFSTWLKSLYKSGGMWYNSNKGSSKNLLSFRRAGNKSCQPFCAASCGVWADTLMPPASVGRLYKFFAERLFSNAPYMSYVKENLCNMTALGRCEWAARGF